MYKTMHEKANSKTTPPTQPPTTRASQTTPTKPAKPVNAPAQSTNATTKQKPKLDKTFFDLLTDVTAELIVESAKLDRLGRYLTKK